MQRASQPSKSAIIKSFTSDTAKHERLTQMLDSTDAMPSLSAHDGSFEMFYPYQIDGKSVAVLYLSNYIAYGKGSY